MKKIICLLIVILALPAAAQTNPPASSVFQALEPSNVRLRLSEDDGIALVFNASPTVCEDLLVDIVIEGQFIDVDAYAPRTDAVCNTLVAFEPVIELPALDTAQAYVLLLNDYASTFYLPDVGESPTDVPFPVTWGDDNNLIAFNPITSTVTSVLFADDNGNLSLRLSGNHPDGCETEVFTRLRQDTVQTNLHHVEIHRLLPEAVACPATLQSFQLTLTTDLPTDVENTIFEISGDYHLVNQRSASLVLPDPIVIDDVTVEANDDEFTVAVEGTQTQDCGNEPGAFVYEGDFLTAIDILTYNAADAACTDEIVAFEDTFTVQTLPVVINGVAYNEEGQLPDLAESQSTLDETDEEEGNLMQVDTVIENVEVAVLESFPMQLRLTVSGHQPDGCDFPVQVEQSVDDESVTVHIYRDVPVDVMCPMVLIPYEENIMVDGSFTGGTIEIQVNDFSTSIDL